eukprot:1906638-Amphidinium_carterae.1
MQVTSQLKQYLCAYGVCVSALHEHKEPWVIASAKNYLPGLDMSALLNELGIQVCAAVRNAWSGAE